MDAGCARLRGGVGRCRGRAMADRSRGAMVGREVKADSRRGESSTIWTAVETLRGSVGDRRWHFVLI